MITKSNQTMEENQEKKFICKFCNKKFACGKSLGGHIRTHLSKNRNFSRKQQEEEQNRAQIRITKFSSLNGINKTQRGSDSEVGLPSSYDLTMNPRCQSLKALCGHKAYHSEKENLIDDENDEESSGKQKLVMDSQSVTETSGLRQRRISKRTNKYKKLGINPILGNGFSSVFGVEQEQQEVAISLMMLSRDSSHKGGLNSFAESSDYNDSVILEAKSSSIDMVGSAKIKDFVKMKKTKDNGKLKFNQISVTMNSDSGYFRNGYNKIEQDVSDHGFQRNIGEIKKLEVESGSEIKGCDAKFWNGTTKLDLDGTKTEFGMNLINEEASNQAKQSSSKYELRKRTKDGFCKIFHSKINGCSKPVYDEAADKLLEDSSGKDPNNYEIKSGSSSKKIKGHECPICFRVFKSGQALGGHKRSHFIGSNEDKTVVIRQVSSETEISRFFDLNLPAPVEDKKQMGISDSWLGRS